MIRRILCRIYGHDDRYTDEFENRHGHAQADAICKRCGRKRLAWTGPKWDAPGMPGHDSVE